MHKMRKNLRRSQSRGGKKRMKLKENRPTATKIAAYLFILPGFIFFCFSIVIPFFMGINIAFTDWNGITKDYNYVGFQNFAGILKDLRIRQPIRNSLVFAAIGVVAGTVFSLGMALLANAQEGKLGKAARTIFFIPVCFSAILTAFIWKFIYKEVFFSAFGVKSPLGNPNWVIPAIILMGLWNSSGINMLIYYSGLKNIPTDLYEAAIMDGATTLQKFRTITLPLLTPAFSVCITLTLTSYLREFAMTLSATEGGPGGASRTLAIYVYENLFKFSKAGYGQAVALIFALFCILLGNTISRFFRRREVEL